MYQYNPLDAVEACRETVDGVQRVYSTDMSTGQRLAAELGWDEALALFGRCVNFEF